MTGPRVDEGPDTRWKATKQSGILPADAIGPDPLVIHSPQTFDDPGAKKTRHNIELTDHYLPVDLGDPRTPSE